MPNKKRPRDELSDLSDLEDDAENEAARASQRKRQRDLAIERTIQDRDDDGYLPGSVVRVKLQNFVTYDAVEFRPGPYLNMIIGPNGTGKSTIVCAIALGLGLRPNVLGRAKDVASFVKQGKDRGVIEIELKGKPRQRGPTIRREISRSDNKSDWYLNGQKTTHAEVQTTVEGFSVKISNLCCFLPQDKVADFARMTPSQLLKEVQKAAGEEGLIDEHTKLTELGSEEGKISVRLTEARDGLAHLQQQQEVLERDVQRFKERQDIERKVKLLELRIPQAKYSAAREKVVRYKPKINKRKAKVELAAKRLIPFAEVKEEYDDFTTKLELRKEQSKQALKTSADALKKLVSNLEKKEETAVRLHGDMASLEKREADRRGEIEKIKGDMREIQNNLASAPPPEVPSTQAHELAVRKLKSKARAIESEREDLRSAIDGINLENRTLWATLDDSRRKLEALDNVRHQRLQALQIADRHAFQAVQWLRENKQLFSGNVYEPVLLEASMKDPRYAAAVESCMTWATFRTFVCEKRSDYDIFTRELIDKQKLRLNVFEVEGFDDALTRGFYPAGMLQSFNFDAHAIDLIDAPPAVLKFLSYTHHLNKIPLALSSDPSPQMLETITDGRQIQRFVYGLTNYNVTISSYGSQRASTNTRTFPAKPRNFGTSVDANRKRELERSVLECTTGARASETKVAELQQRDQTLKADHQKLEQERNKMMEETRNANAARRQYERDLNKLETLKIHLKKAQNRPTTDAERARIRKALQKLAEDRASLAQDIKAQVLEQNKARMTFDLVFLETLQHEADRNRFNELLKGAEDQVKAAKEDLEDVQAEEASLRKQAKKLLNEYQRLHDIAEPEIIKMFEEAQEQEDYGNQEIDDLELELTNQRSALDLAHGISDDVLRTYETRQRAIAKAQETIEGLSLRKQDFDNEIKEIRDHWEPAIRSLVQDVSEKFSNAFERIGCAGEVRVATDKDYDKWGIEILVKFRDTEELQLLTGQRQSGGERSLSTIMFLMGLTELGKSPFSLVDEINQGMDQRAERAVHNQMVDVTCGQHARQYFLITPKLLNSLRYHERMRVLIINNGEWLPEKFSFKSVLKRHRTRVAAAQA